MSVTDVHSIIDMSRLEHWMDEQGLARGPVERAQILAGGTQNVLVRFSRGGREFVLRRPPLHPRPKSNDTIRREARVLTALAGTHVPHPALIAACGEESVLGAAFYLMEPVQGFNPRGALPLPHAADRAMRSRMGFALVEGIAALGSVDHVALGLADFGKVDGFLQRQVARWKSQLDGYREFEGWEGASELGDVREVGQWLERNIPNAFTPGIMHGDYHLSNVMYRNDSAELAAIVDWELATVGDPLIDLGWLVATWPEVHGEQSPGVVGTSPWDGFPRAAELVEHYGRHSSRSLQSMQWYTVLACYKLGILLEGTHARACAGKADAATGARLHAAACALFQRAHGWMGQRLIHL
jgi:aminoglycoside phosphotransferase (APT) family kinase protein